MGTAHIQYWLTMNLICYRTLLVRLGVKSIKLHVLAPYQLR